MKTIVGVSDWHTTVNVNETMITYALGSCIGVLAYDPFIKAGGLLHAMLPFSKNDPKKAEANPAMYVDSGFSVLMKDLYALGAQKKHLKIYVFGGASMGMKSRDDYFKIGARNFTALRKLLWKNGFMMDYKDVGGNISRTVSLRIEDGLVCMNKKPINGNSINTSAVNCSF